MKGIVPEPGPVRVLATAALINNIGNGFYVGSSVLFFIRALGLPIEQVGAGLTAAAIISVLFVAPIGSLSDRFGALRMYIWLQMVQGLAMIVLAFARTVPGFIVAVTVAAVAQRGANPVIGTLVAQIGTPEKRTQIRAYLGAVCNVGISVGIACSGLVLNVNTRGWYVALMLGNAVSFLIAAAVLTRLPTVRAPSPRPARRRRAAALRDRPYMAISALSGILGFQHDVIVIAMPVWIVKDTNAPRWTVSLLMGLNCILITVGLVRAARGVVDLPSASRTTRRSGTVFLLSCAGFAAATHQPTWAAFALLLVALVIHTLGEAWFTVGTFELSHALAPDHARGQYQGAFNLVSGATRAGAPIILTTLCLIWGVPGWLLLGVALAATGAVVPAVAAWAERSRRAVDTNSTALAAGKAT